METLDITITLKHFNEPLDIATAKSRKVKFWKNDSLLWSDFLSKISVTHRTDETFETYITSDPKSDFKDRKKDVGGYVFGHLTNGRRLKGHILYRTALALDLDYAPIEFINDFDILGTDYACAIYSTHTHSPSKPRYRLIIPLDRQVSPDEYEAIGRKIAQRIGMDYFDPTTFQPERFMYWPSTSSDGEFIFRYQDAPALIADSILQSYDNWHDLSEWPRGDQEDEIIRKDKATLLDPHEKPGIIGAFCRAYSIRDAIETFIPEIYEPCANSDRYSYTGGSTTAGVIIFDDKIVWSHHASDPIQGNSRNAFDMVRIHLYGLKGEVESNRAMKELARKDKRVMQQIGDEKLSECKDDYKEAYKDADTDWMKELKADTRGNYLNTIENFTLLLQNDEILKGKFALNKFEQREVITGDLPWRKFDRKNPYLTDRDDAHIRLHLESTYNISGRLNTFDALQIVMEQNSFHPVKDYLSPLSWDHVKRLETLLIDYLGADDTPYTRAVTRKSFVAGVARIFNPGCKFDYVLVIIGKQGTGKSTLIRKLGKQWYSDSFTGFQGKEAYEAIQGVWILEMAELAGLNKAEFEQIKHYISKSEDRFRIAYGKRTENFPRQCVFIGTTNTLDFLRDPTGNRRFWPVSTGINEPTKDLFKELTPEIIDQIWAEALYLYNDGEDLFLDHEMELEAFEHQTEHRERDERTGVIQEYLNTRIPDDWYDKPINERVNYLRDLELRATGIYLRDKICIAEIWCELFNRPQSEMNRNNTKELHNIMRMMDGWEEIKGGPVKFEIFGKQRGYKLTAEAKMRTDGPYLIPGNTNPHIGNTGNTNDFYDGNTSNTGQHENKNRVPY